MSNSPDKPIHSFSQNAEDVRLWRVLCNLQSGFYVDVGAGHPANGSVTRLFYDRGWSGINIEPGPMYSELARERTRDINLRLAVALDEGTTKFYVTYPDVNLSSLDPKIHELSRDQIERIDAIDVPVRRLETVLEEHAADRHIDFLKVDSEGAERATLESANLSHFRPSIVLLESILPWSRESNHEEWEGILTENGYLFAAFDGINRFYVSEESESLAAELAYPISALDSYVSHGQQLIIDRLVKSQAELDTLQMIHEQSRQELSKLRGEFDTMTARTAKAEANLHYALASYRYRFGDACIRLAMPAKPVLRPAVRLARKGKNAKERVRSRFSSASRPLRTETIMKQYLEAMSSGHVFSFPSADEISGYRPGGDGPLSNLGAILSGVLTQNGPAPEALAGAIDETEHHDEAVLANRRLETKIRDAVTQAEIVEILRSPPDGSTRTVSSLEKKAKRFIIVDVRCLQDPRYQLRGVGHHAKQVLQTVLEFCGEEMELVLLMDPALAEADPDLLCPGCRFVAAIDHECLDNAALFIELSPMTASPGPVLPLLLSPSVRCAAIIYDFIPGEFTSFYLHSDARLISYRAQLEALSNYDALLSISKSTASALSGFMEKNIPIDVTGVANPFDEIVGTSDQTGAEPVPYSSFVLIASGADSRKNPLAAIAAHALNSRLKLSRMGLVVVGQFPPEMMSAARQFVASCGLNANLIEFRSGLTAGQLQSLYAQAKLVVVPSFAEGFSIPVIEAVSSGSPVIASDINAHRELLGAGWWLAPAGDPVALGKSMAQALRDPAGLLEVQRQAIRDRFKADSISARVRDALSRLMSTEAGQATRCAT